MDLQAEFRKLKDYYDNNEFNQIFNHQLGLYFLKMRSISRSPLLFELAKSLKIDVSSVNKKDLFEFMFCQQIQIDLIEKFIRDVYSKERLKRIQNEDYIYSQLYKLKYFDWGGFYQNSVERTIVNNYVKKIKDYDKLCESIENDVNPRLKGYILCSWYNHWTSVLIEDLFKEHESILPAVGLVEKVDFFWKDFPFDLKVTHFPDEFMQLKRKERGLKRELTILKKFAREHKICFDRNNKSKDIFSELIVKISEDTSSEAKDFMIEFHEERRKIITDTMNNPKDLIKWLYENQGTRRFDSANRFFLMLINLNNLEESWKLKRNKSLLKENIHKYLNENKDLDLEQLKVEFNWQNRVYSSYSVILFITIN